MLTNLFGELAENLSLKKLMNVLLRLTYDTSGRLRVYADGAVTISSGTVTGVTTVTTSNGSVGDMGKLNTVIANSVMTVAGTRRNFV